MALHEINKERLKADFNAHVPCAAVLSHMGYPTKHEKYRTYMMFPNPWNPSEGSPSLKIDLSRNLWVLFSDNHPSWLNDRQGADRHPGGTAWQLAEALAFGGFSPSNFPGMVERFSSLLGTGYIPPVEEEVRKGGCLRPSKGSFENLMTSDLTDDALSAYARSRGIFPEVAAAHCRQADYDIIYPTGQRKHHSALAFRNLEGGWAMRNAFIKRSTGGGVSMLDTAGRSRTLMDVSPSSKTLRVTEGFFDTLSLVCWDHLGEFKADGRITGTAPACDIVTLNSVANLHGVVPIARQYAKTALYLDNDPAGETAACRLFDTMRKKKGIPDAVFTAEEMALLRDTVTDGIARLAEGSGLQAAMQKLINMDIGVKSGGQPSASDLQKAVDGVLVPWIEGLSPQTARAACDHHSLTQEYCHVLVGRMSHGSRRFDQHWCDRVGVVSYTRWICHGFGDVNEAWTAKMASLSPKCGQKQEIL